MKILGTSLICKITDNTVLDGDFISYQWLYFLSNFLYIDCVESKDIGTAVRH